MRAFKKIMSRDVFIAILDPLNKGGILLMTKFVYSKLQEEEFDPFLVYNIVPSVRNNFQNYKDITLGEFLKVKQPRLIFEEVFGMKGYGIQRILPEFEFLNYVLNLGLWEKILNSKKNTIYFAIGGNNLCALPYVLLNKKFFLWVASPLYEDRIDRIKKENFFRKIRDYFSLPILLYFEKLVFKKTSKVLALSRYTKNKIVKKYPFVKNKIEVVSYPIDVNKFYPIPYNEKSNNYLLFVGRFSDERKNIFLLLRAFLKIKKKCPNLKLELVGDKPNYEIIDFINKNRLENNVELVEFVPNENLLSTYQNALLFIIPSFQEGLCIAGLEALACGIPVISTKCGGPEEYIIDGYNGYLVENNNLNDMIIKITNFLNLDENEKRKMSNNARNYIAKNYSTDIIWPRFLKYFKNLGINE